MHALDRAPARERVAALGEALPLVPEHEREPIALRLFEVAAGARTARRVGAAGPIELLTDLATRRRERMGEEAMFAILSGWDSMPGSVRPLIGGLARDRWIRVGARAAASESPRVRSAVAGFAEDTADPGFAGIVCGLLGDADPAVRLRADRALLRLVMTLLSHLPPETLGTEYAAIAARPRIPLPIEREVLELERVELCRRLSDAAWRFADHRCRSPLIGSLLVLDRVPGTVLERAVAERIRRLLKERNHPSHTPMRTVLRGTPSPLLRERALRWLNIEPVASTCVDRLSSADSLHEHEILLRRAYLAMRPSRARRLRAVRPVGDREHAPVPDAAMLARLSPQARRGMVRFVQLIGLDEDARRAALEPTLADESALVRLAGVHAAHPVDLTDFIYDPDPAIARSAAARWATIGVAAPLVTMASAQRRIALAATLARSPHAEVRDIARAERERIDPFGGTAASRLAGRRVFERDPVAFVKSVRERLADDSSVMNALMLLRGLRLSERFEMDLVDLATTHADDRVRATAVAALAGVDSEPARRVVRASLNAPDPRVRSNALESVEPDPGVLLEYKNDASHRVRGSAVRRVLLLEGLSPDAGGAAGEALARMLSDDRAAHRLSGAWAAERALRPSRRDAIGPGWRSAVRRVIEAAQSDPDPRVRVRAGRCVRLIEPATPAPEAA